MSGVYSGLRVLDLSWGSRDRWWACCSPTTAPTSSRSSRPGGDPFPQGRAHPNSPTAPGSEASARRILDLKDAGVSTPSCLAAHADILIEASRLASPGAWHRLRTLSKLNPRLIYGSITAWGRDNKHSDRRAYDLLRRRLAPASTGITAAGPRPTTAHVAAEDPLPGLEVGVDWLQGPPREGR